MDLIHEGGGRTNAPDDSLYLLKKQFGKNTSFKFRIARQVWNEPIYSQLCGALGAAPDPEFFPAYRAKMSYEFKKA